MAHQAYPVHTPLVQMAPSVSGCERPVNLDTTRGVPERRPCGFDHAAMAGRPTRRLFGLRAGVNGSQRPRAYLAD
jgi:hypothetical protein